MMKNAEEMATELAIIHYASESAYPEKLAIAALDKWKTQIRESALREAAEKLFTYGYQDASKFIVNEMAIDALITNPKQ